YVPGLEGLEMRLSAANTLDSLLGLAGLRGVAVQWGRPGTLNPADIAATTPTADAVPLGGSDTPLLHPLPVGDPTTSTPATDAPAEATVRLPTGGTPWWASPVVDVFGPGTGLFDEELSRTSASRGVQADSLVAAGAVMDGSSAWAGESMAQASMLFPRP